MQYFLRTNTGRRIFNSVFNTKPPEFNDLFLNGRMAYAIDLDDEVAESDIPTTVIRSKADLQGIEVGTCQLYFLTLLKPFSRYAFFLLLLLLLPLAV